MADSKYPTKEDQQAVEQILPLLEEFKSILLDSVYAAARVADELPSNKFQNPPAPYCLDTSTWVTPVDPKYKNVKLYKYVRAYDRTWCVIGADKVYHHTGVRTKLPTSSYLAWVRKCITNPGRGRITIKAVWGIEVLNVSELERKAGDVEIAFGRIRASRWGEKCFRLLITDYPGLLPSDGHIVDTFRPWRKPPYLIPFAFMDFLEHLKACCGQALEEILSLRHPDFAMPELNAEERRVRDLKGKWHDVTDGQMMMLKQLFDAAGKWVTGSTMSTSRPDKMWRRMPEAVKCLIESHRVNGYRIPSLLPK